VVTAEPRNADGRLFLGSVLAEQGEKQEAIDQLSEAVQLRQDSSEAWNALGEAHFRFGDSNVARSAFERAVKLNPRSGVAHSNLGAVLLEGADPTAVADQLERAIQLLRDPTDLAEAHYLLSRICTSRGETDEALKHLEMATKLEPELAEAWSDLGELYRVKLNAAGALASFERAVNLNPNDSTAQYRLGSEYLRRGQISAAVTHLETAYKLAPADQSTLNALQSAYRQAGRLEDATRIKQELAAALSTRDKKSQAALEALKINNEGAELEHAGNMAAALDKYREALKLAPNHNGIRVNYATALLRLGHWTEGLTELHEALQNDPQNRKLQIALKDAIAQAPSESLPDWATIRK
jgi:tetratricopeptide (TPR) repeat protein